MLGGGLVVDADGRGGGGEVVVVVSFDGEDGEGGVGDEADEGALLGADGADGGGGVGGDEVRADAVDAEDGVGLRGVGQGWWLHIDGLSDGFVCAPFAWRGGGPTDPRFVGGGVVHYIAELAERALVDAFGVLCGGGELLDGVVDPSGLGVVGRDAVEVLGGFAVALGIGESPGFAAVVEVVGEFVEVGGVGRDSCERVVEAVGAGELAERDVVAELFRWNVGRVSGGAG